MNRQIAVWTIALVAVLGLTACSAAPSNDANDATSSSGSSSTPADEGSNDAAGTEQSVADACLGLAAPMQEAASALGGLAGAADTPQAAVDAWTGLVNAFGEAAGSASNPDVKSALTTLHADVEAMRNAVSKIYVDGDMAAAGDLATATGSFQTSYTALTTLCAG